jgi:hypothetical protein
MRYEVVMGMLLGEPVGHVRDFDDQEALCGMEVSGFGRPLDSRWIATVNHCPACEQVLNAFGGPP